LPPLFPYTTLFRSVASRNLSIVYGVCTRKPACNSIPIFTPCSSANSPCSFQYGMSFSSHCHFNISEYSVGQGVTGQFGYLESSCEPGVPENVLTTGTSISDANLAVFTNVSWAFFACSLFG